MTKLSILEKKIQKMKELNYLNNRIKIWQEEEESERVIVFIKLSVFFQV